MPQKDAELIESAACGDEDAFTQLYKTYQADVYRYLCYLCSELWLVQDLFQETWLRAVRALPGKSKINNFKHYIFSIATNLYRDELRKLKVRRFFLGEEADPDKDGYLYAENTVSNSLTSFQNIEQWQDIQAALKSLTPRQRAVFSLFYIQDLSIQEITVIVKRKQGTVKATLFQAVQKIKKYVNQSV